MIKSFEKLLAFSRPFSGTLPWRARRSLTHTLYSEIMLQQTTVGAVLKHFDRFTNQFPDLATLAQASEEEVLKAWAGLGYYRRARNLHKAAKSLVQDWDGKFPRTRQELQSIPGIGPYTASALLAMGRDEAVLAIDANLERILSRLFAVETPKGPKLIKELQVFEESKPFQGILAKFGGRATNEALMDLGRLYCRARNPLCGECPLKRSCQAFKMDAVDSYPRVLQKAAKAKEVQLFRVIQRKGNKVLVYQKQPGQWLEGQWELPTFTAQAGELPAHQYPSASFSKRASLGRFTSAITKYKLVNTIVESKKDLQITGPVKWLDIKQAEEGELHLSSATLKALRLLNS